MKKIKYLSFVLVLSLLFVPGNVLAKANAEARLNAMALENEDGTCTWNVKIADPNALGDEYCNFSLQDLIRDNQWIGNLPEEEQLEMLESRRKNCRGATVISTIEVASRKMGNANWDISVDFSNGTGDWEDYDDINVFDPNKLTLIAYYDAVDEYGNNNTMTVSKTCKVQINEVDEKILKDASKVVKKLEGNNVIYSLNSFNSVYHYGSIFQNNRLDSEMILYKFPKFKQSLMENPEFDYEIAWNGGGGSPMASGCQGYVIAYKDGIPYGLKLVNFTIDNRLYVDKDLEGTVVERAYNRLNEFFNGKVDITFDSSILEEDTVDGFVGTYTIVKLGEVETPIFIIEVDKHELDKFEVKAHHKKHNVNVITNSYDVPIDATLEVEDVKKNITLDKNEYKVLGAYDIDVVKTGNGGYVKTIENGIDVFIPVSNRKVGEKLKVFHMEEDNKTGEEFDGEVVEVEGVKYVKFRTTHFSTYAVAANAVQIDNPDTGDNIISSFILAFLSLCGLIMVCKFKPKYE